MDERHLELTISFQESDNIVGTDSISYELRCPELSGQPTGQFKNPLDDNAIGQIRWYLEEYPKWPTDIDRERAHGIEAKLETWGRSLFDAIFSDRAAGRFFQQFIDFQAAQRRIIIESSQPEIQRLPWELLAVDTGPLVTRPQKPISLYRRVRLEYTPSIESFSLPLRVLMVISRPEEAGFVDPRSIALGVLDSLTPLITAGQVKVDFLRPPTLRRFAETLQNAKDIGQPYHIVHFDGHGVYHRETGLGQFSI